MEADDKIKAGYQAAVSLICAQGQVIWRAFATLLSANAILATLAGAILKIFPDMIYAPFMIAIGGLLICVAWFFVLRRQFSYYGYWFAWARHFEKDSFLGPEVKITSVGKTYGKGGTIEDDTDLPKLPRFKWTARVFTVESLMVLIIAVFVLIYALVLVASIKH